METMQNLGVTAFSSASHAPGFRKALKITLSRVVFSKL